MVHSRSKAAGPQRSNALKTIRGRAWSGRLGAVLALFAAALCQIGTGRAQEASEGLPTEPILRIETGQHGAQIRRIDTDAANRFAVTASDDKTARVWSLPEGQLLRILRLPLDFGDIGKAFAVAIRLMAAPSPSAAGRAARGTRTFFCSTGHRAS
jgi:hypothetical protein